MTSPSYKNTLRYLLDLTDYSQLRSIEQSSMKFGTGNISKFLATLHSPHNKFPTIHIAGTKGKGSIAALLSSVLQSAGLKVGLFTSPYLFDFREQIQINCQPISRTNLSTVVYQLKPQIETVPGLTTFEATTGIAFFYFFQQQVDIAVIEAGLGGELDATNVVTPLVSVISPVSYDHTRLLGNTISEITRHKAGIIKPGRPVVSAPQWPEAADVIKKIALEKRSPLVEVSREFEYHELRHSFRIQSFSVSTKPEGSFELSQELHYQLSLLGKHQIENAVTAYATLLVAREQGLTISDSAIRHGFSHAKWQGRFDIVSRSPLVVFDGAHNIDSAKKLSTTVQEYFPGKSILLIIGVSEDKDAKGILKELAPLCKQVYVTRSVHRRAMDVEQVAALAAEVGLAPTITNSVGAALLHAVSAAQKAADLILVTGSLFVVADAYQAWKKFQTE